MKKISFVLIIIVLLWLFTGCGAKQTMEDKIAEKIVEGVVGSDIDIDGDEVTIKTDEGDVTFGSTEWPNTELSSKIPEFKKGKIVSVMNSEANLIIMIEEVEEKDFMDYYERIKGEFKEEPYESKSGETIAYMGNNEDGINITASYGTGDKTVFISASLPE